MSLENDVRSLIMAMPDRETIIYLPGTGSPKAIAVLIDRNRPTQETIGGASVGRLTREIFLVASDNGGIGNPVPGKDTVKFKSSIGDVLPSSFLVTKIVSQDEGAYVLEVTL